MIIDLTWRVNVKTAEGTDIQTFQDRDTKEVEPKNGIVHLQSFMTLGLSTGALIIPMYRAIPSDELVEGAEVTVDYSIFIQGQVTEETSLTRGQDGRLAGSVKRQYPQLVQGGPLDHERCSRGHACVPGCERNP
jgi:hypothetical protein